MGNKASLCGKTNQASPYTDSYQSTSVSSIHSNLKKSFAQGQLSKDNFKILKVIGRGSFGKVFLVEKRATLSPMSIEASLHKSGVKGSARGSPSGDSDSKQAPQYYAMKVLRKSNLLERNQIDHTKTEREVLQHVQSPFLMKMHYAF